MKLRRRLAQLPLDPAARRCLYEQLLAVAAADGVVGDIEEHLIERLLPRAGAAAAASSLDPLWPHAELVLTACIYVAVSDGAYGVEEARHVSQLAHSLGMGAAQLSELEARVFAELATRGATAGA